MIAVRINKTYRTGAASTLYKKWNNESRTILTRKAVSRHTHLYYEPKRRLYELSLLFTDTVSPRRKHGELLEKQTKEKQRATKNKITNKSLYIFRTGDIT